MPGMIIKNTPPENTDRLYVGGDFNSYKGTASSGSIRLKPDGTIDPVFNVGTGFNGDGVEIVKVRTMLVDSNKDIYVGGDFEEYNGIIVGSNTAVIDGGMIRLNPDGTKDTAFNIGSGSQWNNGGNIFSYALNTDGKLYVGGNTVEYSGSGLTNSCFIRVNPDGTKDTTFNTGTGFSFFSGEQRISAIALTSTGKVYAGGIYSLFNSSGNNYIIRLNSDGTKDTAFDNSTGFAGGSTEVVALALDANEKLYVGGTFTSYKGTTANRIIRLNSDGTKDTGFDNSTGFAGGDVYALLIDTNGKIYTAGDFTSYKGTTANGIIRLNTDGTKDTGFDNSTGFSGGVVRALALDSNGKLYVGGDFTSYKGTTANRIIRLNPDGTKDTTFDNSTGFDAGVYTLAFSPGIPESFITISPTGTNTIIGT